MVLEQLVDLRHKNVGTYCENTLTVSWAYKLASNQSNIGGRLLRILAMRKRLSRSSPLVTISIAGVDNKMEDVSSRSLKGGKEQAWIYNTDNEFLLTFN